jgi:hypothetical protein
VCVQITSWSSRCIISISLIAYSNSTYDKHA